MTMDAHELTRNGLSIWLKGLRLPLTALESVVKRGHDTSGWLPSVAFEQVEAGVKGAVGRLTGDEHLVGLARLQRAEATKRWEALAKRSAAEGIRRSARRRAEAERADIEEARESVEERAAEREEQIEEEREAAEVQAAQRAAKKKATARRTASSRAQATDRKAKEAEQARLREEAAALRAKEEAVAARAGVLELDEAARQKKADRKAG
jgi:hypothetical protein